MTLPPAAAHVGAQLLWLLILALPVSCVAWTMTHEEVLRELRDYLKRQSQVGRSVWRRKFFYLFTCEYCLSHWLAGAAVAVTNYRLLLDDWRGYAVAVLALVAVSNGYMTLYGRWRVRLRAGRADADARERQMQKLNIEIERACLERERARLRKEQAEVEAGLAELLARRPRMPRPGERRRGGDGRPEPGEATPRAEEPKGDASDKPF